MGFITDLMKGAANAATGGIIGIGSDILGNVLQKGQQKKMQEMQIEGQKEMTDYNMKKQLEMWEATGYGAQMKQLKEAGLNPSMLYGKGGIGGGSTNVNTGSIGMGSASTGGGAIAGIGMGIQMQQLQLQKQMQEAQIELAKSQANKNNVEAEKTAGVDTTKTETEIKSLTQGIQNQIAVEALTRVQQSWATIQNAVANDTWEDAKDNIKYTARKTIEEWENAARENKIGSETINSKIEEIRAIAIGAGLKNILTRAETAATRKGIQVDDKTISKMSNDMMLGWDRLSNEQKETQIKKTLMEWTTSPTREATQQALELLNNIMKRR